MARITVEDCLEHVNNRFDLVLKASKRARKLAIAGVEPMLEWQNDKPTVMALREIAAGFKFTENEASSASRSSYLASANASMAEAPEQAPEIAGKEQELELEQKAEHSSAIARTIVSADLGDTAEVPDVDPHTDAHKIDADEV